MENFEKDMLRFIRLHKQCDKARLIQNMNKVMQEKGIKRRNKCRWIAEITGVPVGSVNTWFTTAKCRDKNRIPPDAMCLLALALKVPVWRFLEGEEEKQKDGMVKPDRRSRIYCSIRRNEAKDAWNDRYAPQMGEWDKQDKEVKQKFLDELYFQHLEQNRKDK